MGTLVLVTLVITRNSLTLEGFPPTSFFGYRTESEGKSPQCDTYGKKKKLTGVIILSYSIQNEKKYFSSIKYFFFTYSFTYYAPLQGYRQGAISCNTPSLHIRHLILLSITVVQSTCKYFQIHIHNTINYCPWLVHYPENSITFRQTVSMFSMYHLSWNPTLHDLFEIVHWNVWHSYNIKCNLSGSKYGIPYTQLVFKNVNSRFCIESLTLKKSSRTFPLPGRIILLGQ